MKPLAAEVAMQDLMTRGVLMAFGAVAGVLVLDALAGRRHSRNVAIAAITIRRPAEEVVRVFEELERRPGVLSALHSLRDLQLGPAPGGRGTEVKVRLRSRLPVVRVRDDLHRLKQVVETGARLH